jgi:CheY-like chemotaxis protein
MALGALHILVVDDDRDTADSLAMILRLSGYAAKPAYDAASAVRVARHSCPSVVFLDLAMPQVDGFKLAKQLCSLPGMEKAALVCVTGYAGPEYRKRAYRLGFARFLVKPIDPDEVLRLVAALTPSPMESPLDTALLA